MLAFLWLLHLCRAIVKRRKRMMEKHLDTKEDLYTIMDVGIDVSQEIIKEAYRKQDCEHQTASTLRGMDGMMATIQKTI